MTFCCSVFEVKGVRRKMEKVGDAKREKEREKQRLRYRPRPTLERRQRQ